MCRPEAAPTSWPPHCFSMPWNEDKPTSRPMKAWQSSPKARWRLPKAWRGLPKPWRRFPMERIEFDYPAKRQVSGRAHVGVVGSGDLEVLLEPAAGNSSHVLIRTSVD